ncbi:MAG TPA: VOC family protein [Pasteurellaceae bacterium]|nr:VOC family protein [Pasteurellaceae bacterium]
MNQDHILFKNHTALYAEFLSFEQKITALATEMALILADYAIDHIACRVNNCKSAENYLTVLVKCGKILSQNVINGRPIYLIELEQPLRFAGQSVAIVELPFPKNKIYPQEGWEHIEVVMPMRINESTIEWEARIFRQFGWNQSTHLRVKVDEPKGDGERLPNPSIAVSLTDKTKNHTCIKIHPYHIKEIIEV